MTFTTPTVVDFVKRFPNFTEVDDDLIESVLGEASRRVNINWDEQDYQLGMMLYAAHVLTLDGLGSGAESQLNAKGVMGFQSISSGSVSINRGSTYSGDGISLLGMTSYGQRFRELLRRNFAGVAVANGNP